MRLDFTATTVPGNTQLAVPEHVPTTHLMPVVLGDPAPPLQLLHVRNVGPAHVDYDVDVGVLQQAWEQAGGAHVLHV